MFYATKGVQVCCLSHGKNEIVLPIRYLCFISLIMYSRDLYFCFCLQESYIAFFF